MAPQQRRQYSLRQLLLVMLVVASVLGWLREKQLRQSLIPVEIHEETLRIVLDLASKSDQQAKANQRLQFQVKHLQARLRTQADNQAESMARNSVLEIEDPTETYVRQVQSVDDPLTWKFEVYLPPGQRKLLHVQLGGVSSAALGATPNPQTRVTTVRVPEGQSTIAISISNATGPWKLIIDSAEQTKEVSLESSVSFGQTVDFGPQIKRLAVDYQDSNEARRAPSDRHIELFRLSEPIAGRGETMSQTGLVVYFPATVSREPRVRAE